MNNTDRHPECHMRTALGNCKPIGGFCISVNEPICEALHMASRPQGEWIDIGGYEVCKNCHEVKEFPHWNYCPNCGADMRSLKQKQTPPMPKVIYAAECPTEANIPYLELVKYFYEHKEMIGLPDGKAQEILRDLSRLAVEKEANHEDNSR